MKKVLIGIGIPGSGKTTFLKPFSEKNGYSYISPDAIRKAFTGNESDQSKNEEVWKEAYRKVAVFLNQGKDIVFDATFTKPSTRLELLKLAKKWGATALEGIIFDVPLEVVKARNSNRENPVPEEVLERMDAAFRKFPPSVAEGFSELHSLEEFERLRETELTAEGELTGKKIR